MRPRKKANFLNVPASASYRVWKTEKEITEKMYTTSTATIKVKNKETELSVMDFVITLQIRISPVPVKKTQKNQKLTNLQVIGNNHDGEQVITKPQRAFC